MENLNECERLNGMIGLSLNARILASYIHLHLGYS